MNKKTSDRKTKNRKPDYEIIFNSSDDKFNVLVLGTSGSGKSTLINAVLGEELAATGSGQAVTKDITIYRKDTIPIRMIDTQGFEYSKKRQREIKKDLSKFVSSGIKEKNAEKLIHAIWFCIDGTVHRIDTEVLNYLRDISSVWSGAPIIVVFTKSYSTEGIEENNLMLRQVLADYRHKDKLNIMDVVPVVAKAYPISGEYIVQPLGVDLLVEKTLQYAPDGAREAYDAAKTLDLRMKRYMSYSLIAGVTVSASVVGAVPIPIHDSVILVPLQSLMVKKLSSIYGIRSDDAVNDIVNSVLKAGAVTMIAKTALNYLKAIPGINVAASVLNASVAGIFSFIMGEVTLELLEKTYTGVLDLNEIDWLKEAEILFNKLGPTVMDIFNIELEEDKTNLSLDDIGDILKKVINSFVKKGETNA